MTELKSLVNIEITSATAKKGSDEIVSGLNSVNKSAISAKSSTKDLGAEFDRSSKTARTFADAASDANKKAAAFPISTAKQVLAYGTAFLSAGAMIDKFVVDNREFETGMIGVAKTTNLSGKELEDFKNRILGISKEIPVSTNELLELAQAAGQMGVRGSENLEKFAVTMAKVGRSTDLAGADAARGLARILAVSGESSGDLETLANVIVRLGNNSQATESEIAHMTTRIAQSLSVYGIASAQSVALSAAMKSIGITAEQGGSAVGRSMAAIGNSVIAGGKELKEFSEAMNLDSQKLSELFKTDKIKALNYFLEGLASKGESAGLALKDVGLGGTEIASSILPLAKNIDVLRKAQAEANDELTKGTALQNEFTATLKTFDTQIGISKNIIKSYGMEVSGGAFASITESIKDLNDAAKSGGLNRLNDLFNLLAITIGVKLTSAIGAYGVSTGRKIQLMLAENAAYAENAAFAARQAASEADAAKAKLAGANASALAAARAIGDERALQQARIASLKGVLSQMEAERLLENTRMKAQITEAGRLNTIKRMTANRLQEVNVINQVAQAEARLAATTVSGNKLAQAAIQAKMAAEIEAATATKLAGAAAATAAIQAKSLSVASTAAGLASRGLAVGMALLGGPAGVIMLAGAALVYFITRTTDSEARLDSLGTSVDEVVGKFKKMGQAGRDLTIMDLTKGIAQSEKDLLSFQKKLENFQKRKGQTNSFVDEEDILQAANAVEEMTGKVASLKQQLAAVQNPDAYEKTKAAFGALGSLMDGVATATETTAENLEDVTDEAEKLYLSVKKQADLYNNQYSENSRALEYQYDLENGLIERSNAKTEEGILIQYRKIDALEAENKAREKMFDEEDDAVEKYKDKWKKIQDESTKFNEKLLEDEKKKNEDLMKQSQDAAEEYQRPWREAAERIDGVFADAWSGAFDSFKSFSKQMKGAVQKMVGEMIHQLTTKKLVQALSLLAAAKGSGAVASGMSGLSQSAGSSVSGYGSAAFSTWSAAQGGGAAAGASGGASTAASGAMAGLGVYAIAGMAVVAAVSAWNKKQEEKFVKLTSAYKQGHQSMVAVLGEGMKKSDTIANSIDKLRNTGEALGVNYDMLSALLDIRSGIQGVAAGFARSLGGDYTATDSFLGSIDTKTRTPGPGESIKKFTTNSLFGAGGDFMAGFANGVTDKISNMVYKESKKIIDSGVQIMGTGLADIMAGASLEAFNYADVKTTKKFLGIKTSIKSNRKKEDMDEVFENQLTSVFENAGDVLKMASKSFGINFDSYVNSLQIKSQDLSLKGLEGDALTKEIESFFGATLDNWAGVLLGGTTVLLDFQKVGETTFDTMLRLSSETNVFNEYVSVLGLNMKATGMNAIYATQAMVEAAGGFDSLNNKLSGFYSKFYTDEEKFQASKKTILDTFKSMNMVLPATRQGFKNLVTGMDLLTEGGRANANTLLDLVPLMDDYYTKLGDLQEEAAENNLLSAAQLLDYSKKLLDVADSFLLSDLSTLTGAEKFNESQNQFRGASGEDLGPAAQAYLEQARAMYASGEEYAKVFAEVQQRLRNEAQSALNGNQPTEGRSLEARANGSGQLLANNTAQVSKVSNNSVAVNDPMATVVKQLTQANETLQNQLNANAAALELSKKQAQDTALQAKAATDATLILSRKMDDLTNAYERAARR